MKKPLIAFIFISIFALCLVSRADALTFLTPDYNCSSTPPIGMLNQSSSPDGGIGFYTPCGCGTPLRPYVEWTSSFSGASGVSYLNLSCAGCFDYGAFWAKGSTGGWRIPVPANTTVFFQVKYYATSLVGINMTNAPYLALMQYDSNFNVNSPVYAKIYLDSTTGEWITRTVAYTFTSAQNIQAFLIIPSYNNSSYGDVFYFDYVRVGYVDLTNYENSIPSNGTQMADCGFSTSVPVNGLYDRGASFKYIYLYDPPTCQPPSTWDCWQSIEICSLGNNYIGGSIIPLRYHNNWNIFNDNGSAVNMTVMSWNLGEDPTVPCQVIYSNYSGNPSLGIGTYSVRIPKNVSTNSSFVVGNTSYFNQFRCLLLAKDYLYMSMADWCTGYCFQAFQPSYAGLIEVGQAKTLSTFMTTNNSGYCNCYVNLAGGNMTFNVAGYIPVTDIVNASVTVGDNLTMNFRANLSFAPYGVSGGNFRYDNVDGVFYSYGTEWLDKGFFSSYSPFNVSCVVGWYCEDNSEVYKNSTCHVLSNNTCSACDCNMDTGRCISGSAYWTCHNSFESWHYNETCQNDLQLLCDISCDNVTGQCAGESICLDDSDCSIYCTNDTSYYNPYCNLLTYTCSWHNSRSCPYGCNPYTQNCFPNPPPEPLFGDEDVTAMTPTGFMTTMYNGVMGFVNAMGGSYLILMFMLMAVIIVSLIASFILHFVKENVK